MNREVSICERRWWRSRLFWFGLPGFLFLLWGWFAIPRTAANITLRGSDRYVVLGHASRIAFCYFAPLERVPPKWKPGTTVHTGTFDLPEMVHPTFPRAIKVDIGQRGGFNVYIAYWLLILIYLPLWLGSLRWWQRKKVARLEAPLPEGNGGDPSL